MFQTLRCGAGAVACFVSPFFVRGTLQPAECQFGLAAFCCSFLHPHRIFLSPSQCVIRFIAGRFSNCRSRQFRTSPSVLVAVWLLRLFWEPTLRSFQRRALYARSVQFLMPSSPEDLSVVCQRSKAATSKVVTSVDAVRIR